MVKLLPNFKMHVLLSLYRIMSFMWNNLWILWSQYYFSFSSGQCIYIQCIYMYLYIWVRARVIFGHSLFSCLTCNISENLHCRIRQNFGTTFDENKDLSKSKVCCVEKYFVTHGLGLLFFIPIVALMFCGSLYYPKKNSVLLGFYGENLWVFFFFFRLWIIFHGAFNLSSRNSP